MQIHANQNSQLIPWDSLRQTTGRVNNSSLPLHTTVRWGAMPAPARLSELHSGLTVPQQAFSASLCCFHKKQDLIFRVKFEFIIEFGSVASAYVGWVKKSLRKGNRKGWNRMREREEGYVCSSHAPTDIWGSMTIKTFTSLNLVIQSFLSFFFFSIIQSFTREATNWGL